MLGLGWRGELVGGGLEGDAYPHEGEAPSSSRNNCIVAGGAVSIISAQRPRLMCRNRCLAATLWLLMLSLLSQLLSDEERRSWRFRPENISHGRYAELYACTHVFVVSPTRGDTRVLEAGRRRSAPASCGSLARTVLVVVCVPDRKNEV